MRRGSHSMGPRSRRCCKRLCILLLFFSIAATLSTHCDARRSRQLFKFEGPTRPRSSTIKATKKLRLSKNLNVEQSLDSFGPIPFPEITPPICVYPPCTSTPIPVDFTQPPPPPTSDFTPILPNPNPPNIPPDYGLSPPVIIPSPPEYVPNPPDQYEPSPPGFVPSPPEYVPSPGFVPGPPVFLPPVVYPLPNVPPPPYTAPVKRVWCVAKPTVPDPIIQEAMDYACTSGADCGSIQSDGSCFQPDTLFAHASFAFNSYWQRAKATGGTCDFGGTAILVILDPSYDGCQFVYY